MSTSSRRNLWAWAWTAMILAACWFPRTLMPVDETRHRLHRVPHLDKLVHFSMFAGFGLLWMRVDPARRRGLGVLAGGCLLAIVSELGQGLPIVHRDPSVLDGLADTLGLVAGMAATSPARRRGDAGAAER